MTLGLVLAIAGCRKESDVFTREQDALSVDCNEQSIRQNILCLGEWTSRSEVPWLKVVPESGSGNGRDYQFYEIAVDYNGSDAREGIVYLIHNGREFPVTVNQAKCSFELGRVSFSGSLTEGVESRASLLVAYRNASGNETIGFSCKVGGDASAGLSVPSTSGGFKAGDGSIALEIQGTPAAKGEVEFEVFADGVSIGKTSAMVEEASAPSPGPGSTMEVIWSLTDHQGDASERAELNARHPEWLNSMTMNADKGSGVLSIVGAPGRPAAPAIGSQSFADGHLYIKGMYDQDYFLLTCNDFAFPAGTLVTCSGSMGGAGSSAGYFVIEYSCDGTTWNTADGVITENVEGVSISYHAKPYDDITGTELGAFSVTMRPSAASNGTFLVRIKVAANMRMNHSPTSTAINTTPASTRFKGDLKVSAASTGSGGGAITGDPSGLPAEWNFYALGFTNATKADALNTPYAAHWKMGEDPIRCMATSGNADAYFTPVGSKVTNVTMNPNLQAHGLLEGDYFMAVIPVSNFASSNKIKVESATGSAGGSVGYWLLEYSSDGSTWYTAPGAVDHTRGSDTFKAHFWNTARSIVNSGSAAADGGIGNRYTYDGPDDDTYHAYSFALTSMNDIPSGNLYLRLRALKYRATPDVTSDVAAGWTDIKAFIVSLDN